MAVQMKTANKTLKLVLACTLYQTPLRGAV
jgi:hypothetical protein